MSTPLVGSFYAFNIGAMWRYFRREHFAFWMICGYLFVEFVRPQSIIRSLDILPWAQLFVLSSMLGLFLDTNRKSVKSVAIVYFTIFMLVITVAMYVGYDVENSKRFFSTVFSWYVIFILIIYIVNTPERFYVFFLVFFIAGTKISLGTAKIWAFRGFAFTNWGISGPPGFFQNSGELAILMLLLFPVAFYLYMALKDKVSKWEKWLLLGFWIAPVMTILGASSRGAQIALVLQAAIMFRKHVFKFKPLIAIVTLGALAFLMLPEEQKQRFSDVGEDKTSRQRLLYWEHGFDMMNDYPFFGVGLNNFAPYYDRHYPEDVLYDRAELPHNIFIQIGTDGGYTALLFFCLMLWFCLRQSIKNYRHPQADGVFKAIAAGLGMGVFGFVVAGQFVTVSYYPFLWIHMAFIVAQQNILRHQAAPG